MSYAENPYSNWGLVADEAPTNERAGFIRQTYMHLAGAVMAFVALEAVLLSIPGIGELSMGLVTSRWGWLAVLGGFVAVSWVANYWANNSTSVSTQYLGLGLYVVAEAVIFVPLLYIAQTFGGPDVIPMAGLLTVITFSGLTAVVFLTGADFSFLRNILLVGAFAGLGVILGSAIWGFQLGLLFIGAMLALSGGYIVYHTSNILHHYRIGQHVAASLALFASVALMFWYMVQLVMSLTSRD